MYRPLVYESWDLDSDKILPERTHLYHLQPLGIGSIFVESLTGYIARLAEAHDISPAMPLQPRTAAKDAGDIQLRAAESQLCQWTPHSFMTRMY